MPGDSTLHCTYLFESANIFLLHNSSLSFLCKDDWFENSAGSNAMGHLDLQPANSPSSFILHLGMRLSHISTTMWQRQPQGTDIAETGVDTLAQQGILLP